MTFENKFVCTYCEPLMWLFLILVCQPDFWLHIDIDPRHFDECPVWPDCHHQPNVCVLTIPSLKFGHSSSTIPSVRGYHGVQRILIVLYHLVLCVCFEVLSESHLAILK